MSPYSLTSPQQSMGGISLPTDYSSLGSYGMSPNFDGIGGNGMRFPGIKSSTAFGGSSLTGESGSGNFWDKINWFDKTGVNGVKEQGMLLPALGTAQGLFNAWMGMKQYGLAKEQLAEGKRQFGLNYDAQRTTTNAQLQDRQAARVASNPGAYQSVSEYMAKNGIGGR